MKSACMLMTALFALSATTAAWAAGAGDGRGPAPLTAVSGAYSLTFNVRFASPVPTGATIQCKARIVPGLSAFDRLRGASAPVQTASGKAQASGSRATCTVEVPFSWMVGDSRNGVALAYEVDEVSAGAAPVRAQQEIGAPYPAAGARQNLVFNIAF